MVLCLGTEVVFFLFFFNFYDHEYTIFNIKFLHLVFLEHKSTRFLFIKKLYTSNIKYINLTKKSPVNKCPQKVFENSKRGNYFIQNLNILIFNAFVINIFIKITI